MNEGGGRTLREIDEALGLPKGSAFRAFKRLAGAWREGRDYRVIDAAREPAAAQALREAGRAYAGSLRLIVLDTAAAERVQAFLRASS